MKTTVTTNIQCKVRFVKFDFKDTTEVLIAIMRTMIFLLSFRKFLTDTITLNYTNLQPFLCMTTNVTCRLRVLN